MVSSSDAKKQSNLLSFFNKKNPSSTIDGSNTNVVDDEDVLESQPMRTFKSPKKIQKQHKTASLSFLSSISSPTLVKSSTKKLLSNMLIDLGQIKIQCNQCGMVYVQGMEDKVHTKFCNQHFSYRKSKDEKIVWEKEYSDEKSPIQHAKIILVNSETDRKPVIKKAEEFVKDVVDKELGSYETDTSKHHYRYYLYVINNNQIVGILVAEPIQKAHRVIWENETDMETVTYNMEETEKALIGVSRIWVHGKFRRKGIAKQLLGICTQTLLYGIEVPKEKVAFSQPTLMGKQLAIQFCDTKSFLVYKEA